MQRRGHILKLTAVSVLVVMALTGFSSKGRGHGGSDGDSSGGGGGGCSSSSQDHDSTSSSGGTSGSTYDDYDDDDYAGTSGGSGDYSPTPTSSPAQDATVELVTCTSVRQPYATVTVTNPNAESEFFTVTVDFLDAENRRVERGTKNVFVGGNQMERVEVDLPSPDLVAKVDHCQAGPEAPATY
ncbi:hypothetical protein [Streptomyces shaanxiensis]